RAIERRQAVVDAVEERERWLAMLCAVGLGYIDFALEDPGNFEVAMFGLLGLHHPAVESARGDRGLTPYELLVESVGHLVDLGVVAPEKARTVTIMCWSTVHGFSTLATRGPLRDQPRAALDEQAADVVRTVVAGLPA
ncbi:MAG: WHG domain-containing protein, partial [Actinobacteria bacterium]|nr:WHG domain-containing protein [Actinomycetota bacterium]